MRIDLAIDDRNDDKIKNTLDYGSFMPTLTSIINKKKIILGILSGLFGAFFINKFGSGAVFHVLPKIPEMTSNLLMHITTLVLLYLLLTSAIFGLLTFLYPEQLIRWLLKQCPSGKCITGINEAEVHNRGIKQSSFRSVVWICFGSVLFLYVFVEWVFFITKPSFMDAYSIGEKVSILLGSYSTASILILPIWVGIAIISRVELSSRIFSLVTFVAAIIPAAFSSLIALLLIDNFTYTILGFGIVNSEGITRAFYLGLFVLLFLYYITKFVKLLIDTHNKKQINYVALSVNHSRCCRFGIHSIDPGQPGSDFRAATKTKC